MNEFSRKAEGKNVLVLPYRAIFLNYRAQVKELIFFPSPGSVHRPIETERVLSCIEIAKTERTSPAKICFIFPPFILL